MADTGDEYVKIHADTGTIHSDQSYLYISLGSPKVVDYWPRCTAACANSDIGIVFNQSMDTATFASGVEIHECFDATCATYDSQTIAVSDDGASQSNIYRLFPLATLRPDTSYIVIVSPRIRAQSMFGNLGNAVEPFSWTFRTKEGVALCAIDSVQVSPDPFVAYAIGEHTSYTAIPRGSPDTCSRFGQELNPSNYGWSWQSGDSQIASVSTIARVAQPRLSCTNACVPRGSTTVVDGSGHSPALCGDGVIDSNEDCDLAHVVTNNDGTPRLVNGQTISESVGVSCSASCLRPGNTQNTCGNGLIEPELGEECDPGGDKSSTSWRGCSQICLRTGSSQINTVPGEPRCGNRSVDRGQYGQGEDCEINTSGIQSQVTCTSNCF
jgi:hypothetical protein